MLKTNVDKIMDILSVKKKVEINDLAKALNTKKENLHKTVEYLQEEGLIHIDFSLTKEYLSLIQQKKKISLKDEEPQRFEIDTNLLDTAINDKNDKTVQHNYSTLAAEEINKDDYSKNYTSNTSKPQDTHYQNPLKQNTFIPKTIQKDYKNTAQTETDHSIELNIPIPTPKTEFETEQPYPKTITPTKYKDNITRFPSMNNDSYSNTNIYPYIEDQQKNMIQRFEEEINSFPPQIQVEKLIDKANEKIDKSDLDEIHILYQLAYDHFMTISGIDTYEKNLLKEQLSLLFSRIKKAYLNSMNKN